MPSDIARDNLTRAAALLRYRKQQALAAAARVEKAEAALEAAERDHAHIELQLDRARRIIDTRLDALDMPDLRT